MGYKYQANAFGGAAEGYLKYNISPDLTGTVVPGETITITGEAYYRDSAVGAIRMTLKMADGYGYVYAVFPRTIAKGRATQFTLTYALPEEVLDQMGDGRTFVSELDFGFLWGAELTSGGVELTPASAQAITILRYRLAPAITAAKFSRCRQNGGGWERWDEGVYVLADNLQAQISESADVSDVTVCRLEYADEDGGILAAELDPAALIAGYSESAPAIFADVQFLLGREYAFTLKMGDAYDVTEIVVTIPRAFCNFHLSGAVSGGAAFGMFSGSADGDPKLESAYPLHAYAGVYGADGRRLDGTDGETVAELSDSFQPYTADRYPVVQRTGKLVYLQGVLAPTASISGSTTEHRIFSLPRVYWPLADVYQLCQGTGCYKWLLHVSTEGAATFSRYSTSSYASASAGTWLPFQAIWIASDYEGPLRVQRPASAMTANSSAGCVASASSVYHTTSYPAWKAFDFNESTGWASQSSDGNAWLQLEMDVALKNIVVQVYARETSYIFNPVAGQILGSNDGSAWTEIGSFSGWNGGQSGGLLGEVSCGNETAYRYVRLSVSQRTSANTYVAVGYMRITGELPE